MNKTKELYEKAGRLNLIIIYVSAVLLSGHMVIRRGFNNSLFISIVPCLVTCGITTAIIKFIKNDFWKGIFMPVIVSIAFMAFVWINKGANHTMIIIIATVVMSAAYFDLKIIITYSIYANILVIMAKLLSPFDLLGEAKGTSVFILHLIGLIITSIVLICLVRWVTEIVQNSQASENKSNELLKKNNESIKIIEDVSKILADSVNNLDERSKVVKEECSNISEAIGTISKSVKDQTDSLTDITLNTKEVSNDIEKTYSISNKLEILANNLNEATIENKNNINKLQDQMKIIDITNKDIIDSVDEFNSDMTSLSDVSEIIRGIAKETNLLALNAEIEAARAGEHGKSFSVVASEVRKLALEVGRITEEIDKKIQAGLNKLKIVSAKVDDGNIAAKNGTGIVTLTAQSFEKMTNEISEINLNISDEYKLVENINNYIKEIYELIEKVNCESEECTAAAEDVASMQEKQSTYVSEMMGIIENVDIETKNLNNLLE